MSAVAAIRLSSGMQECGMRSRTHTCAEAASKVRIALAKSPFSRSSQRVALAVTRQP